MKHLTLIFIFVSITLAAVSQNTTKIVNGDTINKTDSKILNRVTGKKHWETLYLREFMLMIKKKDLG